MSFWRSRTATRRVTPSTVAERLEEQLGSSTPELRLKAARLLAALGAREALSTLEWLAESDADAESRAAAQEAVAVLRG